jgi:hypothetical protein
MTYGENPLAKSGWLPALLCNKRISTQIVPHGAAFTEPISLACVVAVSTSADRRLSQFLFSGLVCSALYVKQCRSDTASAQRGSPRREQGDFPLHVLGPECYPCSGPYITRLEPLPHTNGKVAVLHSSIYPATKLRKCLYNRIAQRWGADADELYAHTRRRTELLQGVASP